MTKFLKPTGLVLVMMWLAATAVLADSHVYKLYVDGLACPFCAYGVEKKVGGLDGVDGGCGCAPLGADKMSALQHSVGAALGYLLLAFLAAWARMRIRTRMS